MKEYTTLYATAPLWFYFFLGSLNYLNFVLSASKSSFVNLASIMPPAKVSNVSNISHQMEMLEKL